MPHRSLRFVVLFLLVWCSPAVAQEALKGDSFTQLVLREKLPQWMDRYNVPGVHLVLVEEGIIARQYTFGWADRDRQIPLQASHVFPIGHWIKPLISQLILTEVKRGNINLDLPIHTYLEDKSLLAGPYNPGDVTVRTLLQETDGLRVPLARQQTVYTMACRNLAGKVQMQTRPDREVLSHAVGYALLIQALEYKTDVRLLDLLTDRLSAKNTITWPETMSVGAVDSIAQPHTRLQRSTPMSMPDSIAGCRLLWRPDGLARFLMQWQAGQLPSDSLWRLLDPGAALAPEPTESLWQWNGRAYNAGFFIDPQGGTDSLLVLPDAGLPGFYHEAYFDPKNGDGLFICTNSQNGRAVIHRLVRAWSRLDQRKIPRRVRSYFELDQVVYLGGFFVLVLSIGIGVRLVLTRHHRSFLISRKWGYLIRLLGWMLLAAVVWMGSSVFLDKWVPHLYEIALVPLWLYAASTLFWVLFPRRGRAKSDF